ncbi:Riboflavin biosynthesis protein RibD [Rubripirellula lacrimiformis]|uniref:Riboflavin biosynthesis protein RibD n=2 Tax=Rubripirellula lacrimiformis TaxID=1930273 RepID=A0A517N6N5_9BACT|nr:Riboflavin biosynthesis protein RibD [Rubripirellula lacrimiformis]
MQAALDLARSGQGHVEPNPMVGCVIVRDGCVVGQGFHGQFGGPHAEVAAIRSLANPADARGATAYVTLEPCCHFGKTPPCADALIEVGVGRVVVAMEDPFDQVSGGGIAKLRAAGIEVTVGTRCAEAGDLNAPFLKRVQSGLPWVIAKWAMTIDGRIATVGGESQWITGASSRAEVHRLRGRVDAIVVGMGTVVADDPTLTARPAGPRAADRVVYCRNRLPSLDSNLVRTAKDHRLILVVGPEIDRQSLDQVRAAGAEIMPVDAVDLAAMARAGIQAIGESGATNVMLEGGSELLGSFFLASLIDECHVYVGAKAFGGAAAPGPVGGIGVAEIAQATNFKLRAMDQFDDDVRLIYRRFAD